jgi:hypothetical protein
VRSELDWAAMFGAFREAFEWTLDVAKDLARDYPDEVAAVERVRSFMHAHVAGRDARIRADDVLFTLALIVGAIERDLGPLDLREPRFDDTVELPAEWDESGDFRVRFAA